MSVCEQLLEEQDLLERIRCGDDKAFAALLDMCMPMIRQETSRFRHNGADEDDLAQEAALGLLCAAKAFRENRGASIMAFARVCIRRRLINAMRRVTNEEIPHESPLDMTCEGETAVVSPDQLIQEKEEEAALLTTLKSILSDTEYRVLILHIASYSYKEIAGMLQMTQKAVDNALQRIRRKLKKAL